MREIVGGAVWQAIGGRRTIAPANTYTGPNGGPDNPQNPENV